MLVFSLVAKGSWKLAQSRVDELITFYLMTFNWSIPADKKLPFFRSVSKFVEKLQVFYEGGTDTSFQARRQNFDFQFVLR